VSSIPLIDISDLGEAIDSSSATAQAIVDAAESVGFFAIQGHGIDARVFSELRHLLQRLFSVPDEIKHHQRIQRDNYRGFIPLGFFTPNRADPATPAPDAYEGYKLHWECPEGHPVRTQSPLYGANRWPDHVPELQARVLRYWRACDQITDRMLAVFEAALGLPAGRLRSLFTVPVTNMTLLHYPPTRPEEDVAGIHPHKDTNVLTLLHPDPVGGLEVRSRDGNWIEATCPNDALMVNTGDMMEVWSGGRFLSTPHRVINTTGAERYSFPYFSVPDHDVVVTPMVDPKPGFVPREPVSVGPWSLEVWRTNWADARPEDDTAHLGTIDF